MQTDAAHAAGHDFEGVEIHWREQLDELDHLEVRIEMLGGKLGKAYRVQANSYVHSMLEIIDQPSPAKADWDAIVQEGHALRDDLIQVSREDLGMKDRRWGRRSVAA